MSELIQRNDNRATIRWKLLTGASALALTAYVSSTGLASAEDSARPQVWIDLSGQLNQLSDSQEIYTPPFLALEPSIFAPPRKAERPPLLGVDGTVAITIQPEGSNWNFSASIRYGRSSGSKHVHQQTYPTGYPLYFYLPTNGRLVFFRNVEPIAAHFIDTKNRNSETHAILDFDAGKDVGLGLFGHNDLSSLSLGVRIAQFTSKSQTSIRMDPDWHFTYKYASYPSYGIVHSKVPQGQPYHSFAGTLRATRTFHGIGPSLSWKSSVPLAGNEQNGMLMLDWGLNAATLFGRQRTKVHHQTTGRHRSGGDANLFVTPATNGEAHVTYQHPATPDQTRSRNVTVPNVGGFVGLSYSYSDAKLSFGYRADMFFNAIDGGIDVRKDENRGFFGPYASISVGLGD